MLWGAAKGDVKLDSSRFKAPSSMHSQNNSADLALDERTQLLMFIALEKSSSANGSFMDM